MDTTAAQNLSREAARHLLDLSHEDRADNLIPCTCDTTRMDECTLHGNEHADRFDLHTAANAISLALGVPAAVWHTGGGCFTIYVGPGVDESRPDYDPEAEPLLMVGPGGSSLECYIGPNPNVYGDVAYEDDLCRTMPEYHANPVAWLVGAALDLYPRATALPVL